MRMVGCLWAALLLPAVAAADEADPFVGRWQIEMKSANGILVPLVIVDVARADAGVSAKVLVGAAPGPPPAVREVVLQAGELRFTLDIGPGVVFKARRVGDKLEGRAEVGATGTDWVGTPTKSDKFEQPADFTAFTTAVRLRDPAEKRSALEKFLADFPKSTLRGQVYAQLLSDLFRATPVDAAKATELIDKRIAESGEKERPLVYNEIADRLMNADILLDRALELVEKSVASTTEQTPRSERAMYLTTLGQVQYKRKAYDAAAASLKKALALGSTEASAEAQLYLGKVEEARGDNEAALESYLQATAVGMGPELKASLERAYTRKHGSLAGLHEKLDAAILARPRLFDPGKHRPAAGQSGRVVLAELFTGAECRPCLAADLAFDGLIERYPRSTVAVIEYHLHVPGPDPMTNADAEQRGRYYGVRGTPTVLFDGTSSRAGGGPARAAEANFEVYRNVVDERLAAAPAATFTSLALRREGKSVVLSGELALDSAASARLEKSRLRLVLVEELVHYTGANGIHFHHFVARKMLGSPEGARLEGAGGKMTFTHTVALGEVEAGLSAYLDEFEKKRSGFQWRERTAAVEPRAVGVVAFVQNDETREVLQAAFAK